MIESCPNFDGAPLHSESPDTVPRHTCSLCECPWCGDDTYQWGFDPVECGHDGLRYCSPEHARADCGQCHGEANP